MDKKNKGRRKERRKKDRRIEDQPDFAPKHNRRKDGRRECDDNESCYDEKEKDFALVG